MGLGSRSTGARFGSPAQRQHVNLRRSQSLGQDNGGPPYGYPQDRYAYDDMMRNSRPPFPTPEGAHYGQGKGGGGKGGGGGNVKAAAAAAALAASAIAAAAKAEGDKKAKAAADASGFDDGGSTAALAAAAAAAAGTTIVDTSAEGAAAAATSKESPPGPISDLSKTKAHSRSFSGAHSGFTIPGFGGSSAGGGKPAGTETPGRSRGRPSRSWRRMVSLGSTGSSTATNKYGVSMAPSDSGDEDEDSDVAETARLVVPYTPI